MANKICQKCGKMMDENLKFYTYKDGTKTEMCKNCLTMHIDNFDPDTFLWLLEKMDVPYVEEEWNIIRNRAFKKNPNLNGMSVFGKYLSLMKLKQWNKYSWKDTEALSKQKEEETKSLDKISKEEREEFEKEMKKRFDKGEITESEYKTMISTETQNKEYLEAKPLLENPFPELEPVPMAAPMPGGPEAIMDKYYSENSARVEEQTQKVISAMTEEDKMAMAMKWGALYTPSEWIDLEKDYQKMMNSFDIQDADTTNTLILICKTNLKMNQALDSNDMEGFQKLSRVSESLRKSAKFTAAQNKEQKNDFVDSVGELVSMCERDGFIPRYETDIPQDKVDLTLKDMKSYLYKLVTQDLGFGQQIEDALKKIQIQKEMDKNAEDNLITSQDEEMDQETLIDQDYEEFYNSIKRQKDKDGTEEGVK